MVIKINTTFKTKGNKEEAQPLTPSVFITDNDGTLHVHNLEAGLEVLKDMIWRDCYAKRTEPKKVTYRYNIEEVKERKKLGYPELKP